MHYIHAPQAWHTSVRPEISMSRLPFYLDTKPLYPLDGDLMRRYIANIYIYIYMLYLEEKGGCYIGLTYICTVYGH